MIIQESHSEASRLIGSGPGAFMLNRTRLDKAWFRRLGSQQEAIALIMTRLDDSIARQEELIQVRERDGDVTAHEVIEAADLASFDPGPEGERIRRYLSTHQRGE